MLSGVVVFVSRLGVRPSSTRWQQPRPN